MVRMEVKERVEEAGCKGLVGVGEGGRDFIHVGKMALVVCVIVLQV